MAFPGLERIYDNHFHLNYDGNYMESVNRFRNSGGTAINLTNLPVHGDNSQDHYINMYGKHLEMAENVRKLSGLDVMVTIGPYPMDLFTVWKDITQGEMMAMRGIDQAARLIQDHRANAIGEVGRPHFKVDSKIMEACSRVMEHAFFTCSDLGVPVILHTEDLDASSVVELEKMAVKCGINPSMVVKHHAIPSNLDSVSGITFSIPANRSSLRESLSYEGFFMLETDHINDPLDPGKFLPADAVPKRAEWILQEYGERGREKLRKAFIELPEKLFGRNVFLNDKA
jgi:TatD-related deoxyribonuclease